MLVSGLFNHSISLGNLPHPPPPHSHTFAVQEPPSICWHLKENRQLGHTTDLFKPRCSVNSLTDTLDVLLKVPHPHLHPLTESAPDICRFGESFGYGEIVAEISWPHPWIVLIGAFLSTVGAGLQTLIGTHTDTHAHRQTDLGELVHMHCRRTISYQQSRTVVFDSFG